MKKSVQLIALMALSFSPPLHEPNKTRLQLQR